MESQGFILDLDFILDVLDIRSQLGLEFSLPCGCKARFTWISHLTTTISPFLAVLLILCQRESHVRTTGVLNGAQEALAGQAQAVHELGYAAIWCKTTSTQGSLSHPIWPSSTCNSWNPSHPCAASLLHSDTHWQPQRCKAFSSLSQIPPYPDLYFTPSTTICQWQMPPEDPHHWPFLPHAIL